jgi:hypothetical protein
MHYSVIPTNSPQWRQNQCRFNAFLDFKNFYFGLLINSNKFTFQKSNLFFHKCHQFVTYEEWLLSAILTNRVTKEEEFL